MQREIQTAPRRLINDEDTLQNQFNNISDKKAKRRFHGCTSSLHIKSKYAKLDSGLHANT